MADAFRFETVDANGLEFHCASCGPRDGPLILFLHGFPEYWAGWSHVMPILADRYHCVAPDQRGYNLSSRPQAVEDYALRHLVRDMAALADHYSPGGPFVLAGHDWGASVAYAYAMRHPDRLKGLVIANGVHPVPFQRALIEDEEQIAASQYFHLLRADKAERVLSEDGYRRLIDMFASFSGAEFMDDAMKTAYIDAWSQPGALTGMLNWYRASAIHVPVAGEEVDPSRAVEIDPEQVMVRVPHLLIHGLADRALKPSSFAGLERFAPELERVEIADTGHWVLHEKPEEVAEAIGKWLH